MKPWRVSELIYDKLTGLMTPFHFYESAKRVKSWADRKGQPLSVIAIRLPEMTDDALVNSARKLNSELRGGDLLARMGERTFVLLLLGDQEGARHLIFRLANTIKPKLDFSSTFFSEDETLVEALNRLGV